MQINPSTECFNLIEANKRAILEAMRHYRIRQIEIEYQGDNAKEEVNNVLYRPRVGRQVAPLIVVDTLNDDGKVPMTLDEALKHLAYKVIRSQSASDSCQGSITLNTESDSCHLKHTSFFTESVRYERAV